MCFNPCALFLCTYILVYLCSALGFFGYSVSLLCMYLLFSVCCLFLLHFVALVALCCTLLHFVALWCTLVYFGVLVLYESHVCNPPCPCVCCVVCSVPVCRVYVFLSSCFLCTRVLVYLCTCVLVYCTCVLCTYATVLPPFPAAVCSPPSPQMVRITLQVKDNSNGRYISPSITLFSLAPSSQGRMVL